MIDTESAEVPKYLVADELFLIETEAQVELQRRKLEAPVVQTSDPGVRCRNEWGSQSQYHARSSYKNDQEKAHVDWGRIYRDDTRDSNEGGASVTSERRLGCLQFPSVSSLHLAC
jgi:hypothetical protein